MDSMLLSKLTCLNTTQKAALQHGNILTISDLVLLTTTDVGKRCKLKPRDAESIVTAVYNSIQLVPQTLDDPLIRKDEVFTTGDETLDVALGGGVRTGMLWEVVGQSAAGKTQLSLQLSLFVQLSRDQGGLSGAACLISTSWTLPTNRIVEIIDAHPALSPTSCNLSNIHTLKAPSIPSLLYVLSDTLPAFIHAKATQPHSKPVKLIIIDALTELFHSTAKTSADSLSQRSKSIGQISTQLHTLARKHGIAVVVLNEVSDAFNKPNDADRGQSGDVLYKDQAQWFGRADFIPGEDVKEAALGLVWANQINARIMLSRTQRLRQLSDIDTRAIKRRKLDHGSSSFNSNQGDDDSTVRIRRLSVIFSSVGRPCSLDYIITKQGVVSLGEEYFVSEEDLAQRAIPPPADDIPLQGSHPSSQLHPSFTPEDQLAIMGVLPSDDAQHPSSEGPEAENGPQDEEQDDEWDQYWKSVEGDDDLYNKLDVDALSSSPPH